MSLQPNAHHDLAMTNMVDTLHFFNLEASPPAHLVQHLVHSPSKHTFLDNRAFPSKLRVTVPCEILDLDPRLVGDENGVTSLVVSRFYHHVTRTPMFQVDFGRGIGAHSVRMGDNSVDLMAPFPDMQCTLFPNNIENGSDIA